MIGTLGIIVELYHPGAILPGVAGGICLFLAFFALQVLPVNYVGILLIILAIILFVVELKVPSVRASGHRGSNQPDAGLHHALQPKRDRDGSLVDRDSPNGCRIVRFLYCRPRISDEG